MKHEPTVTANAVGVTTAIVYVICRILVSLFPDLMLTIVQSWFHGIELNRSAPWNLTIPSFLTGLVSSTITAWLIGYLFANVYNYFAKGK